jgi:hypothetical protein
MYRYWFGYPWYFGLNFRRGSCVTFEWRRITVSSVWPLLFEWKAYCVVGTQEFLNPRQTSSAHRVAYFWLQLNRLWRPLHTRVGMILQSSPQGGGGEWRRLHNEALRNLYIYIWTNNLACGWRHNSRKLVAILLIMKKAFDLKKWITCINIFYSLSIKLNLKTQTERSLTHTVDSTARLELLSRTKTWDKCFQQGAANT